MTFGEIVVNHNLVAIVHQLLTNHTSNIAGTSGYKDAHANTPWKIKRTLLSNGNVRLRRCRICLK